MTQQEIMDRLKKTDGRGDERSKLNRALIKANILAYPKGTYLTHTEIYAGTRYRSSSSLTQVIQSMATAGEVIRVAGPKSTLRGQKAWVYEVPNGEETTPGVPEINEDLHYYTDEKPAEKSWTFEELEAIAIKFEYYCVHGRGTVPEFLIHLKEEHGRD